jgi:glycosyl transferase family 1
MEGWGISVIEANACGTPAIAFNVPGLREAIIDGYSGVLAPDGADLETVIAPVLRDEALRRRLTDGALARATEFSWARASDEFFSVVAEAAMVSPMGLLQTEDEWHLVVRRRAFGVDGSRIELVHLAPRVEQYGR